MPPTITSFAGTHLDAAAELLAARQWTDRLREPDLPSRYEEPAAARAAIEVVLNQPMTEGVVALDGGRLAGYLIGSVVLPSPTSMQALFMAPRAALMLEPGYTAEPEARGSGVAGALLATAFRWARDAGYARCTINWHTANLLGGRFWQRSGFRPLTYNLTRVVDERIAWADAS